MLANIYLHIVLDRWFVRRQAKENAGYAEMIRYADDFVICVEKAETANQTLTELRERFAKYGLELSEEKTRIVKFGRKQTQNGDDEDDNDKPGTFNFLGFTHYWGKGRNGSKRLKWKTEKKRYAKAVKKVQNWLKKWRSQLPLPQVWGTVSLMMKGHFRYFGVNDNSRLLNLYHDTVQKMLFKWLNRRSQRKTSIGKISVDTVSDFHCRNQEFTMISTRWPSEVSVGEEPYAGNPHVRFREGGPECCYDKRIVRHGRGNPDTGLRRSLMGSTRVLYSIYWFLAAEKNES